MGRQLSFSDIFPARVSDPDTSKAAAAKILPKVSELERKVLDAIRAHPNGMTIQETADFLDMHPWSVSPRFKPLFRKGLIYDAGRRICPETNRPQIVWKAVRGGNHDAD